MSNLVWLAGVLALTATVAQADPTCLVQQPRARSISYTGKTIAGALLEAVTTAKNGLCSGSWPILPNGDRSSAIRRSNGNLVLHATRHDQRDHRGQECVDAFSSIINTCVSQGTYWGGNLTANNVDYAVYNDAYPKSWGPKKAPSSHVSSSQRAKPNPKSTRASIPASPKLKPKSTHPAGISSSVPTLNRPTLSKSKIPARPSPPIRPAGSTAPASFRTTTLLGVTGAPSAYSQITTTNDRGDPTVLPVWFDAAGLGVLVVPLAAAAVAAVPPPPVGLPPVNIGPDGQASPDASPNDHASTPAPSAAHSVSRSTSMSQSLTPVSSAASSTTSSAIPTQSASRYMIRPKDGHAATNDAVTTHLTETFGRNFLTISDPMNGVVAWAAQLTPRQFSHYKAYSQVSSILPDTPVKLEEDSLAATTTQIDRRFPSDHLDSSIGPQRRADVRHQNSAGWDLVAVSYPSGQSKNVKDYVYDVAAGEGSTIYVFDSGANVDNTDYKFMSKRPRWIFVEGYPRSAFLEDSKTDQTGHGSCVLSKAAGNEFGVAKRANTVIVKVPWATGNIDVSNADILNGLSLILGDVLAKKSKRNILVISWRVLSDDISVEDLEDFRAIFAALVNNGVVITIAAGNEADKGSPEVNSFPAVFADEFPIIVVGATKRDGTTAEFSQGGDLVTIGAPGKFVECARGLYGSVIASGTSYAAPIVGGLAAYLFSVAEYQQQIFGDGTDLLQVPKNMRTLIQSLAYKRGSGTLPVIFNGVNWLGGKSAPTVCPSEPEDTVSSTSTSDRTSLPSTPSARPTSSLNPNRRFQRRKRDACCTLQRYQPPLQPQSR
ncbi:MAG: deoxyhypusine hydroxylase [Chaenotheca gracillima]|nr:MAG: deoxyhypusine hydroxylase [Chaenotheca gracillima]